MTVDVMLLDVRLNLRHVKIGILHPLAAFDDHRRANEFQFSSIMSEIAFDTAGQQWLTLRKSFIHHDQRLGDDVALVQGEHLFEQIVVRAKNTTHEINTMAISQLNCSLDAGHCY